MKKQGFELLESIKGVTPYLLDDNTDMVKYLCDTANSVTGEKGKPFTSTKDTPKTAVAANLNTLLINIGKYFLNITYFLTKSDIILKK